MDTGHSLKENRDACDFGYFYKSNRLWAGEFIHDKDEKEFGLNLIMQKFTGKNNFSFNEKILEKTMVFKNR